jgi:hypothetical protein
MERAAADVDVVRRIYAASRDYLSGNREPAERELGELIAPSASLIASSALASGSVGPYHGARGMAELLAAAQERWSSFDIVADEFIPVGPDTVVVLGRVSASRQGGQGYAVAVGQLWQLDGQRVVGMHSYQSQHQALEQVGLSREDLSPSRSEEP